MTEFQLQLQRRREQARRTFEHMAAEAKREGCDALSRRLAHLGWNVGAVMFTATPPALADKLKARLPKLIERAKQNPAKSWLELMPMPRRRKQRAIINASNKGTRR